MVGPLIEPETAQDMLKTVKEAIDGDDMPQLSSTRPDYAALAYAMSAAAILLGDQRRFQYSGVQNLTSVASDWLKAVSLKGESVRLVQCLAMLTILSTFHPAFGSTWHLLGLAITECVSLGMHDRNVEPRSETDSLFWSIFVMDRSVSLAYGRPFSLSTSDINIELPQPSTTTPDSGGLSSKDPSLQREGIAHALLMTGFRHHDIRDYSFHATNHQTWMHEFPLLPIGALLDVDLPPILARKYQYRLRCRAWAELAVIMFRDAQTTEMANPLASKEISGYLELLRACSETHGLLITTIEALDAVAGTIAHSHFTIRNHRLSIRGPGSPACSLSRIKSGTTITSDILTAISQRFSSMILLREMLRTFVTFIEDNIAGTELPSAAHESGKNNLITAMAGCGALLPKNMEQLILETINTLKFVATAM